MDADGNNPAPNAQPVNLKIENVKIPDFHGIPSKDSTTAQSLIQRINNLSAANNWDTSVAYHQFAIALKSKAQKRLEWQSLCAEGPSKRGNGSNQGSGRSLPQNLTTLSFWINWHT